MKVIIFGLLLLLSNNAVALGRVVAYEEIKEYLFGSVQSLSTCGQWHHNNMIGEFRLITLYYAGQDMLFVDIVALNESQSQLTVVHGFTFSEINNDHSEVGIHSVTCQDKVENQITVKVSAVNGHNDETYDFLLHIDAINKRYQYKKIAH